MANAHAVTALVPTDWARRVDGFDQDLKGGEDSEFYIHLLTEGLCGTRLPEALFVYTNAPEGRSKRFRSDGLHDYTRLISERYGGKPMGCCQEPAKPKPQLDRAAPGLVLARPKWGGNRQERGNVTGFLYPRVDKSVVIEMDPRDAAMRPDLWEVIARPQPTPPPEPAPVIIQSPIAPSVPTPDLQSLAQRALQFKPAPPPAPIPPPPAPVVPAMPNVERVTRLAQRAASKPVSETWHTDASTGAEYAVPQELATEQALQQLRPYIPAPTKQEMEDRLYASTEKPTAIRNGRRRTGDPVFVFADKDYPSYTDAKRLVELSGFESYSITEFAPTYLVKADLPVIFLSPEQPYFVQQFLGRHIWWSLEYGGEYEPDLSGWRGEVWASDPAWAKAHDAKFVIMGSHPDLCPRRVKPSQLLHDVTMLAYMTPRRERIKAQLADLAWPMDVYPGYGDARDLQLMSSRLMLHVHQRDDTHAIAPQRIALASAYQLPLIAEYVPDAGEYGRFIPFVKYENLNGEVRSQLAMYSEGIPQARAERLHDWLCNEWTFRRCVEEALKS